MLSLENFAPYLNRPSKDQVQEALKSGSITVDTNILYRLLGVDDSSADYMISALSEFGDRFFISHIVALEFKRGYRAHLRPKNTDQQSSTILEHLNKIESAAQEKINRKYLVQQDREQVWEDFKNKMKDFRSYISKEVVDASGSDQEHSRRKSILGKIYDLSTGKVVGLSDDEFKVMVEESLERVRQKMPPGYLDAKKDDGGYGDGVFWLQSYRRAAEKSTDLVIISDDQKQDWIDAKGSHSGAKLREEFWKFSNGRTFVYLSSLEFVRQWAEYSQKSVPESVVDSFSSQRVVDDSPAENSWSMEDYIKYSSMLTEEFPRYAEILDVAIENGGSIDREEILELLGREPSSRLTRFVLPFRTVANRMAPELAELCGPYEIFSTILKYGRAEEYHLSEHLVELHEEMEILYAGDAYIQNWIDIKRGK